MLQKKTRYCLSDTNKYQVQPLTETIPDSCKMTTCNTKTEQKKASHHARGGSIRELISI